MKVELSGNELSLILQAFNFIGDDQSGGLSTEELALVDKLQSALDNYPEED